MKRALHVALCLFCSISPAASAQAGDGVKMPKVAPDFRVQRSPEKLIERDEYENANFTNKATFNVVPKTRPQAAGLNTDKAPLSGNVSRIGASEQGGAFGITGGASIIDTPPVTSGAVSKTVPPEMFKAWINKAHPTLVTVSQPSGSVVDVKGRWNDSSRTLKALGIPHERVGSGELKDMPFDNVKVLIVDCAGTVPRESLQRIRDFVARGGFLLATDWAIDNLVQKAFPGYVEYDGKKNEHPIYDAYAVNPDPILFANAVTNAHWKMDEASRLMRVLKPGAVRVLARSRQLEKEDPGSQGVLAVTFPFGRGYVMHMVGHFDNNGFFKFTNSLPDPAPSIGISLRQALAANFVVAGLTGKRL